MENALPVARRFIQLLIAINILAGVGILALLFVSYTVPNWADMLGVKPGVGVEELKTGMRLIAFLGLLSIPLNHVFFTTLLSIVDTVRAGDPFVMTNATRLKAIAWVTLAMQCIHLAIGVVAKVSDAIAKQLDLNWQFEVTPWLVILLLFVLAKVFEHGARMRADLEGTV